MFHIFAPAMHLIFDTETTGLPLRYDAPMTSVDNWPRVIQLAWANFSTSGELIEKRVDLIKPKGWSVPNTDFHKENGFSQERNILEGIPIEEALGYFIEQINKSALLVAHNINFDYNIIGAEMIRAGLSASRRLPRLCTMESSVDFCALPKRGGGYKYPKLEELHKKLFGCGFDGAHDAMNDVMATAKCLYGMFNKDVLVKQKELFNVQG